MITSSCTLCETKPSSLNSSNIYIKFPYYVPLLCAFTKVPDTCILPCLHANFRSLLLHGSYDDLVRILAQHHPDVNIQEKIFVHCGSALLLLETRHGAMALLA